MNILANILLDASMNVATAGSSECIGAIFEEPTCPEEIL